MAAEGITDADPKLLKKVRQGTILQVWKLWGTRSSPASGPPEILVSFIVQTALNRPEPKTSGLEPLQNHSKTPLKPV